MAGVKCANAILRLGLVASLVSACSPPTPEPTPGAPATTPLAATVTTVLPTERPTQEAWDYVVMGVFVRDAVSYVPTQYARFIEQDQGVSVLLHEQERLEPDEIRQNLQTNGALQRAIQEAEVITFDYAIDWINMPESLFRADLCKGADNQDCLREAAQQAQEDWTGIVDLIAELRAGTPVLIRVFLMGDWFYDGPYIGELSAEKKAVLLEYYHQFQSFMEDDAARRGIPVVRIFPEPYYNDGIPPEEYLQPDGIHFSEQGSMVLAELLRDLGYGVVVLE